MARFFTATGRFAVRFRWAMVGAWIAATVLAGLLFPSLTSVANANNASLLPAGTPSTQAARLAMPFQRPGQTPVPVIIARTSGKLTAADLNAVERLRTGLAKVSGVRQVRDLGISRDGAASQLVVEARVNLDAEGPAEQLTSGLRHAILAAALPGDLHAHLAGQVAVQVDAGQTSHRVGNLGEYLSIVFILLLLLVVFRSALAPLLTLAPAVLVTQLAGPAIAEASKAGLQVSPLTEILVLVLTLGAGTDYGLFLVFRVREELRAGRAPHDAVTRALGRVGESVTFSAATVIAALLTLLLASFGLYSSLGAPLAIAIALMLLAGLTLLPALLAIFGRAAFWPSNTTKGTGRRGWWGRTAGRIVAHPGALERTGSTVTSAGLVLAGTFGVFALVISGQPGGGVYRDILSALALGILLDAFGVRTLLVPSTVALLGRWNWWPSARATRPGVAPRPPPGRASQTRRRPLGYRDSQP